MSENALLVVTGVTKSYADVQALKSASLELRAGEVHALIGENGAGKSTLIKIITGAVVADSGEVKLNGQTITNNSPRLANSRRRTTLCHHRANHLSRIQSMKPSIQRRSRNRWPVWAGHNPHNRHHSRPDPSICPLVSANFYHCRHNVSHCAPRDPFARAATRAGEHLML